MTIPYACTIEPDQLLEALGIVFFLGVAFGGGLVALLYYDLPRHR